MIIAIHGQSGHGKDLLGSIIQELLLEQKGESWQIRKFAAKVKQVASLLTNIPVEKFEDQDFKKSELGDEWSKFNLLHFTDKTMTVREFLQRLGTDALRNKLHKNVWVNALMSDYTRLTATWDTDGNTTSTVYPNWIITDLRFENELMAVKSRRSIVIKIDRPDFENNVPKHPSETALKHFKAWDAIIVNDGTVEDLRLAAQKVLMYYNLL
jgi:hypothetical protein